MMRTIGVLWTFLPALLPALLPAAAAAAELEWGRVEYRTVSREHRLDGVVEAVNQTTVSAQASGRVREVYFDVDDYVAKGEVILRLDDSEQRAGLAQAEATLEEAEARDKEARAEYLRIKDVYAKNLVSKSAMDKAEAGLKAARARFEAAQAGVDQAREQLGYAEVKAPYSGIVVRRYVEPGELATPGKPLMSGLSLETLRVQAHVPQLLIDRVRSHNQARVLIPDGEEREVTAERMTYFPHSDATTHTFPVRVHLPPGQHGLYPGMFVKVAFVTGEARRLVVPAAAVTHRSEVTAVYVRNAEGRVRMRQVRVGRDTDDGAVVVLAGLDEGEEVALDPVAAVRLVKRQAAGE